MFFTWHLISAGHAHDNRSFTAHNERKTVWEYPVVLIHKTRLKASNGSDLKFQSISLALHCLVCILTGDAAIGEEDYARTVTFPPFPSSVLPWLATSCVFVSFSTLPGGGVVRTRSRTIVTWLDQPGHSARIDRAAYRNVNYDDIYIKIVIDFVLKNVWNDRHFAVYWFDTL
jgi:hypothetical protein